MSVSRPDYLAPNRLVAVAGCLLALACDDSDPAASPGELGRASFRYQCIQQADQHCQRGGDGLPERVAVGGRFGLLLSGSGQLARPVSREMVRVNYRDQLEFLRPGAAAFVAVDAYDDDFHDFVHLLAAPATELRVLRDTVAVTRLRVRLGQSLTLAVAPYRHGNWLAGTLNAVWTSSDPEVLPLSERGALVNLSPATQGSVEVTVEHGELSATISLEVGPPDSQSPPSTPGDAGDDGSSAREAGVGDGGATAADASAADAAPPDASSLHPDGSDAGSTAHGDPASDDAGSQLDANRADGAARTNGDDPAADADAPSEGAAQ